MSRNYNRWLAGSMLFAVWWTVMLAGCSRNHYRVRADVDAYGRLREKTDFTPWMPPSDYSVYPDSRSRLYDPSNVNDPRLPIPAPQLYAYDLPEMAERDPVRFQPGDGRDAAERVPRPDDHPVEEYVPPPTGQGDHGRPHSPQNDELPEPPEPPELPKPSADAHTPRSSGESTRVAVHSRTRTLDSEHTTTARLVSRAVLVDETVDDSVDHEGDGQDAGDPQPDVLDTGVLRRVPIPESYWNVISVECLRRMFEFESVRQEYEASFGRVPEGAMLDDSPRLALEDIIELTLINSRELQTQKETLYRAALALTLERFDYELKPSTFNNTATTYRHNRINGETFDELGVPTNLELEKMLYTGGDILARFANNVILTFNGPQGFAADVSSQLFFELTQSVFQRDILLEDLTQAERRVVYEARNYARFRRQLFVNQAGTYYELIRQFRQVEINSQNYFTLVREFDQRTVEYSGGFTSRNDVDQIEQRVISSRQGLLIACNTLENSLDSLKLSIGLPTEQLLNLDLSELNLLTLRDELAVNAKLIQRARTRLADERASESPAPATLLSSSGALVERMIDSQKLRIKLGDDSVDTMPLEKAALGLQIEKAHLAADYARDELATELSESPTLTTVFQRVNDVIDGLLRQIDFQVQLFQLQSEDSSRTAETEEAFKRRIREQVGLRDRFLEVLSEQRLDLLPVLLDDAEQLQTELESQVRMLNAVIGRDEPSPNEQLKLQQTVSAVDDLLVASAGYVTQSDSGLAPLNIDMDAAMMTALVQRFDLMNERGFVADDWRQIKYDADDLKSVLNLRASQSLRTRHVRGQIIDFTDEASTTTLNATLDLPFNRRAQRNRFRTSLFDYQDALRRLMQLEDNVKLSVRRDLRSIALDRERYVNDVASAALAFERVVSVELELRIGTLTSRDFLESQTAFVASVSSVAGRHIDYIVGRLQLFLDLESLSVGDDGFWDQLYDEEYQPEPSFQLPDYALPAYGELHPRLRYSPKIRRMERVPTGTSMIHRDASASNADEP